MKCSILKCPNENSNVFFYQFPDDPKIRAVWVAATGIKDFVPTHNSNVCGRHFAEKCHKFAGLQLVLRSDAVPTKYLSEDASILVSEYLKEKQQNDSITCEPVTDISNKEEKPPAENIHMSKIKVVDMSKLLKPQLLKQQTMCNEHVGGDNNTLSKPKPNIRGSSSSNSLLNKCPPNLNTSPTETFVNDTEVKTGISTGVTTGITRFQVISCLKAILPPNFNFFRLKPSEKLALLVMRYLKLDEKNKVIEKTVIDHLKIIIEHGSIIFKPRKRVDHKNPPYTKINDGNKVYDASFNVERNKENLETKETVGVGQEGLTTMNYDNSAVSAVGCSEPKEFVFVNVDGPAEITHESEHLNHQTKSCHNIFDGETVIKKDVIIFKGNKRKHNEDTDWKPESKKPHKDPVCKVLNRQSQPPLGQLKEIVTYLHQNKCSAEDVLSNFQQLFRLFHNLNKRVRRHNTKDIKFKLNYIIDNNIDMENIDEHLHQLSAEPKRLISKQVIDYESKTGVNLSNDVKLRMRPVVVLQDLMDFRMDQLLFMKREEVESNDLYNQTPISFKKNLFNQNYSSEEVRKLTSASYQQFRRIVLKRNGTKAVYRRTFTKLLPGTVVFAKDFSLPFLGWFKGVIKKSEGPLKYQVQLSNGSLWSCTADQLRPVLKNELDNVES